LASDLAAAHGQEDKIINILKSCADYLRVRREEIGLPTSEETLEVPLAVIDSVPVYASDSKHGSVDLRVILDARLRYQMYLEKIGILPPR
jgi:hypothetical protein